MSTYASTPTQRALVAAVAARLDIHVEPGEVDSGVDLPAPAATVYAAAVEALSVLALAAPAALLYHYTTSTDAAPSGGRVTLSVPSGALRLLRASSPAWLRDAEGQTEDGPEARLARMSPYGSSRAHPIVTRTLAGAPPVSTWEAFPAAAAVTFVFMPATAPEALSGRLREAVTWEAAAMLATTLRDGDAAALRAPVAALLADPA